MHNRVQVNCVSVNCVSVNCMSHICDMQCHAHMRIENCTASQLHLGLALGSHTGQDRRRRLQMP